ncbi:arylsulfatase [Cordyceps fumosorosea ARSEF 2679]|uniref:Arylsulfatase n=1 Tax=Cordyceps fumosorosea (strain ARSEF 2679) TaxID=1081104 RepID=A0A166XXT5_CORFA|nr:arylsulfatase [Cordyceps fumosorosea ARSEF 2679]OAA36311.1 arylsulfatase [Cordyceps fumosorosea ARSEF 2679]
MATTSTSARVPAGMIFPYDEGTALPFIVRGPGMELSGYEGTILNSYKTLRVLGDDESRLYLKWCTGDAELYNTKNPDLYKLTNLSLNPDQQTKRLIAHHNALLVSTKFYHQNTYRSPWTVLQTTYINSSSTTCTPSGSVFSNLRAHQRVGAAGHPGHPPLMPPTTVACRALV